MRTYIDMNNNYGDLGRIERDFYSKPKPFMPKYPSTSGLSAVLRLFLLRILLEGYLNQNAREEPNNHKKA